jgi:cytohesin
MLIPGTSLWFTRSREQQGDHVRVAKLLLKFGTDPNARDNNNNTALHLASQKRHVQVVEILLDCGADPNAQNKDNRASLDLASEAEYVKVVRLLRYHADLNACENEHHKPFHLAWQIGHGGVIQALLEHRAIEEPVLGAANFFNF